MLVKDILPVLYHTQRNNKLFPFRTCMTTSASMAYSYFNRECLMNLIKEDDDVFEALNSEQFRKYYLANTSLDINWLKRNILKLREIAGVKTNYNYLNNLFDGIIWFTRWMSDGDLNAYQVMMSFEDIKTEISDYKNPIIFFTNFTRSGHICLIVGYDGDSIVYHDPYGDIRKRYKGWDGQTKGAQCKINYQKFVNGIRSGDPYRHSWAEKNGKISCVRFVR